MKKVIFLTAILIALTGCGSKTASPNSSADKADKAVTSETTSENIKTTQSMDTKKAVTSGTTAKTTTKKVTTTESVAAETTTTATIMEKLPEPQDIMDLEPESIRHASEMGEREVIYFKLVHPAFYVSDSQFRYSGFMILSNGEVYDISLDSLDDGFPTIDSAHENLEQLYKSIKLMLSDGDGLRYVETLNSDTVDTLYSLICLADNTKEEVVLGNPIDTLPYYVLACFRKDKSGSVEGVHIVTTSNYKYYYDDIYRDEIKKLFYDKELNTHNKLSASIFIELTAYCLYIYNPA